jgi:adenylate cyclase
MPPYVIVQSLDRRLEFLGDLQASTILIGAIGVTAGIALGLMMALAVSRPIAVLRDATHEVQRENLGHRVTIETNDEFSELGEAFNEMIGGLAEKRRIRSALDKSVSPEVADHILKAGAALGGERRRATMLFSDIRGFTTLAENLAPESLIGLLNAHFTRTNDCIAVHHGITDKFIGDAVMAVFGVPVLREQHALDAVRAGQDLLGTLDEFNRDVASQYDCEIEIGVGVNTGDVVAGLVGSADRLAFTTVGDDVNLASRLEGLTKMYGVKMILGEETIQELRETAPEALRELPIRELDRARVKGKLLPVAIFELMIRSDPVSEITTELELFRQARRSLAERDFDGARTHLESVLAAWPEDGGARSLFDRCERYAADPSEFEKDFDGPVRVLTSK